MSLIGVECEEITVLDGFRMSTLLGKSEVSARGVGKDRKVWMIFFSLLTSSACVERSSSISRDKARTCSEENAS